jgi:hypothetical protein
MNIVTTTAILVTLCVSGCATMPGDNQVALINAGDSRAHVLKIMGNPGDRQFNDHDEVWQYCGTGFVNDSFVAIFLHDGIVRKLKTYRDDAGDIGLCRSHFATIKWGDEPDLIVDVRSR